MKIGSPFDLEQAAIADDYWFTALRPRLTHIDEIKTRWRLQNALEREAVAMQKALSMLHTRYNAVSPIGSFPPELLSRIFSFSIVQEPPGKSDVWESPSDSSSALGWIKVTHICRYWRDAALQEPNLWTDVNYSLGLQWSGLMLARSKTVPISVSNNDCKHLDRTLLEHFFHLSHLDLRRILRQAVASWNTPAPLMESLLLSSNGFVLLPVHAFGDSAPSLRKVVLRNVYLSYGSPLLANLTHLEIRWSYSYLGTPLSEQLDVNNVRVDLLLGSLTRMPALRTLVLLNCIPLSDQSLPPASNLKPCVGLVHLETLRIEGIPAQCAAFMDHLAFPQVCKFYMELHDPPDVDEVPQPSDVLSGLRAHFLGSTSSTSDKHVPLTLAVLSVSREQRIRAWRYTDSTCDSTQYACIPKGEPDIDILPHGGPHPDTIQDICNLLPLEELRVLWKEGHEYLDTSWTTQQWLTTLGRCVNLEHIYLDGDDILHICAAFPTPDAKPETVDSPENPKASRIKLQSLTLHGINFGECYTPELHESLAKWLGFMAVPRLRISASRIDVRQVISLEKVTQVETFRCRVFQWDEAIHDTSSDD